MDAQTLAHYRNKLLALGDAREGADAAVKESAKPVQLDQARVGRLSRMEEMQAQAIAVAISRRNDIQQTRIKNALKRIEAGEYGICLTCKKPLDRERLDFDPTAFLCAPCAERAETARKR